MSIPRHFSGQRGLTTLVQHPGGLFKAQIAELTGLSMNQVTVGLLWIREEGAYEHSKPFVWTRSTGYQLAPDTDILHIYKVAQFHAKYVGLVRFYRATIAPHIAVDPSDEWLSRASHVLVATCDFLEGLMTNPAHAQ